MPDSLPRPAFGFNPRSPCGERLRFVVGDEAVNWVSTHAPLAGSDYCIAAVESDFTWFQPTLPLRGATRRQRTSAPSRGVSTHAPLAGSDGDVVLVLARCHVSTHAPLAGSDTRPSWETTPHGTFQPTLPLRGATSAQRTICLRHLLQPTLPLRGATLMVST